jgi:methylmalonyl-CoA/ethylmalonyl-CoA epimerase
VVTGIDHIGILVTDIDAALRFYCETFGLTAGPIEVRDDPPIRRACVRIGETELELIETDQPERTMMQLLPHRFPGIYHIGLRVDDVDAAAAALERQNIPLVDGVREGEQMRIQFVHPSAAQGTMIELVTRTPDPTS